MRRLASTLKLSKEKWLQMRKQGITGTDAAAICGLNQYRSAFAVYQDKISEEIDLFDNEAMRQGRDLEEYVAQRFQEETGKKVKKANAIFQNDEHEFMLADFDRLIVGEKAGLECKTVNAYSADQWTNGAIPFHYQLQCQHYLAVSGYETWYIAALILGKEFVIRKIERDEELISYLIRIEGKFWNDNVLARVMPEPDGTENCSEAIANLYSTADKEKSITLLGFNEILNRRNELDALISKMEQEKAAIDQKIKLELQDASYGTTDDYKVSWVSSVSKRLDTKLLKEAHPDVYEECCKESNYRRFTIKHVAA